MTVLVGYISTPQGEAALQAGVEESRRRKEPLLVVNMSRDDVLADPRRTGAEQLARLDRDLADLGVAHEVRQIDEGNDAAEALLGVADADEVSVIVIGLRHRTPVGKLLMGSAAQRILLEASVPVLAVKAS